MEVQAREVAVLLKTIANENRLMILCILEEKPHTVSELNEKINNITMPALSQHLTTLKLTGLITSEKKGLHVVYHIKDERIINVIKVLKEMYC